MQIYIVRLLKSCSLTIFTCIACISTLLQFFHAMRTISVHRTLAGFFTMHAAGPSLPVEEAAVFRVVVELSFIVQEDRSLRVFLV